MNIGTKTVHMNVTTDIASQILIWVIYVRIFCCKCCSIGSIEALLKDILICVEGVRGSCKPFRVDTRSYNIFNLSGFASREDDCLNILKTQPSCLSLNTTVFSSQLNEAVGFADKTLNVPSNPISVCASAIHSTS